MLLFYRFLATSLFFLIASSAIVQHLLAIFYETRAIPAEEFPPIEFLLSHKNFLWWIQMGCVALFTGIFLFRILLHLKKKKAVEKNLASSLNKNLNLFSFLGEAFILFGIWMAFVSSSWLFVSIFGFLLSVLFDEKIYQEALFKESAEHIVFSFSQISLLTLKQHVFKLILFPVISFVVVAFFELFLYTYSFSTHVFLLKDFYKFGLLAFYAAVLAGLRLSFEILFCFFLLWISLQSEKKRAFTFYCSFLLVSSLFFLLMMPVSWRWNELVFGVLFLFFMQLSCRHQKKQIVLIPFFFSLYIWMRTKEILIQFLGDEINALGIYPIVLVLLGLLSLFLFLGIFFNLFCCLRKFSFKGVSRFFSLFLLSTTCPIFLFAWWKPIKEEQFISRFFWVSFGILGALLFLFTSLNYPGIEDYSELLHGLYSLLIGWLSFLFVALCYIKCPKPIFSFRFTFFPNGILFSFFLLVVFGGYYSLEKQNTLRMIGGQYSKITRRNIQLAFPFPRTPLLKIEKPSSTKSFSLAKMETFPTLPQLSFYQKRQPPIIFIIWDAARADHTSVYGYNRKTTPALEHLAKESIVFENAYSNATATSASLRHLFTGKYSTRYMLAKNHAPFFTGKLYEKGYDCFLLNIVVGDFNGVSRNAFLRNQPQQKELEKVTTEFSHYEAQYKTKKAIALLREKMHQRKDRAFPGDGLFLFLHYAETHSPWINWEDHVIYGKTLTDRYDNSMGHQDKALADLLKVLKELNLYKDAILILTADHGTGLGEHGRYGGFQPYEEQIRVPLVLKMPQFTAKRILEPVAGIDLAPTLLSLFNPGEKNIYDGFSLLDVIDKNVALNRNYFISFNSFRDTLALLDLKQKYKLHFHRSEGYQMLYSLLEDPKERFNLADQKKELLKEYKSFLHSFLWKGRYSYSNPYHYRHWFFEQD